MENLSIHDDSAQSQGGVLGGAQGGPQQQVQQSQQLPPQMFTTAAQLLDMTDSMSLFVLRFGTAEEFCVRKGK
jgi:hypothetical protein